MEKVIFRETLPIVIENQADLKGLPGTDSIGMGYDIFAGSYASPMATTERIFDLSFDDKVDLDEGSFGKPKSVRVQTLQNAEIDKSEGNTCRKYQKELGIKASMEGSYGFFSGSVSAQFSSNEQHCQSYSFVSQTDRFFKYQLTLEPDSSLNDMVREKVRNDLDNLEPTELFKKYGTHFLNSLIIGATSVYSSATNTSEYSSSIDYTAALALRYKNLTGSISGEMSVEEKEAVSSLESSSKITIFVQGGQAEKASTILEGSYKEWIDTVADNMAFVAFSERNSLLPIWELCSGERKAKLKDAYNDYARGQPVVDNPDIGRVHHFSTNVSKSRHYHSMFEDDYPDADWQLRDSQFKFYSFDAPADDRVPIYRLKSAKDDPKRFKLSQHHSVGHGWADADKSKPVFWAYKERGEGRVAVFGFTSKKESGKHGWLYTTDESVTGWSREETTFYAPMVD